MVLGNIIQSPTFDSMKTLNKCLNDEIIRIIVNIYLKNMHNISLYFQIYFWI